MELIESISTLLLPLFSPSLFFSNFDANKQNRTKELIIIILVFTIEVDLSVLK